MRLNLNLIAARSKRRFSVAQASPQQLRAYIQRLKCIEIIWFITLWSLVTCWILMLTVFNLTSLIDWLLANFLARVHPASASYSHLKQQLQIFALLVPVSGMLLSGAGLTYCSKRILQAQLALNLALAEARVARIRLAQDINSSIRNSFTRTTPQSRRRSRNPVLAHPCQSCIYWNWEALSYLNHPCAVHPSGRPEEDCRDWEAHKPIA